MMKEFSQLRALSPDNSSLGQADKTQNNQDN